MKAIGQSAFGGVEVLQLVEVPKPTPLPRDLLVRIKAVSSNPVDCKVRTNYGAPSDKKFDPPLILGWDAAGIVEEVGSEVKLFKVGDEVFFAGVVNKNGANAQYTIVDERIVGHKPKKFTWEQAAAVPLTGLTAYEGLAEQLGITPQVEQSKKTILVVGAAGGVGSIVVQLSKKVFNLTVIGTASRPESVEFVKTQGADHIINHNGNLQEQLTALGFKGVDYIFDTVDLDSNFDQVAPLLNPFGKIVGITGAKQPINYGILFPKRATLTWELMFTRGLTGIEMERQHEILEKLSELVDQGVITDRVTLTFKLSTDLSKAHIQQESGKTLGKIVLTVDF